AAIVPDELVSPGPENARKRRTGLARADELERAGRAVVEIIADVVKRVVGETLHDDGSTPEVHAVDLERVERVVLENPGAVDLSAAGWPHCIDAGVAVFERVVPRSKGLRAFENDDGCAERGAIGGRVVRDLREDVSSLGGAVTAVDLG